jgi:ubiquitin-like protein Pup
MAQIQRRPTPPRDGDDDQTPPRPAAPQARDSAVDALLDDIDAVLEVNAEAFVRSFVQKGGQ